MFKSVNLMGMIGWFGGCMGGYAFMILKKWRNGICVGGQRGGRVVVTPLCGAVLLLMLC